MNNFDKGIELGKIWMKKSICLGHGYDHAERVEKHARKIFEELKPKDISFEDVQVAIWWHDSYKSTLKRQTIYSFFYEGREAEKIARRELDGVIEPKRLKPILEAIRLHNHWPLHFKFFKMSTLTQILCEADKLDSFNTERLDEMYSDVNRLLVSIAYKTYVWSTILQMKNIRISKYTLERISKFKY